MPTRTVRRATKRAHRLSIEDVTPLAQRLARRLTLNPHDIEDLVQLALIAFWEAEQRPTKSRCDLRNPWADARLIMMRAMYRYHFPEYYRKLPLEPLGFEGVKPTRCDKRGPGGPKPMLLVDLRGGQENGTQVDLFEMEDYLAALQSECGPTARTIVENLISPEGECARRLLELIGEKVRTPSRNKSGKFVRRRGTGQHRPIRLSASLVRTALNIPQHRWSPMMADIRAFTADWLSKRAS